MAFFDEFTHLKIQLEEIKLATDNFADNKVIGNGGFGKVYKGEISHSKGRSMVAFKRLDSRLGQGNSEFWKEVMMLSRHTHENLISLVGYCDEGDEKILAYEYASRGSLERYLGATNLTWTQRLRICLEAARGLSYLHDPKDTQQRVLHRDIKSANILLDENWNAKISDLGLSKIGPANQLHTLLVSNAVGTPGYCDPQYMETGFLSKESDVYSFGVVLFEVLCGRLCFIYNNGQWEILVRTWKQSYEQKNMVEIIFQDLMLEMDSSSLKTFSDIAYRCLQSSREERPTMAHVVKELEIALEVQEISQGVDDYRGIIKTEVPSLIYRSKVELEMILSKGILVNGGKTWFSLNKKGEHVEMISAAELSITNKKSEFSSSENSRFPEGSYLGVGARFNTHARTRFLSPGITYTINLVFKVNPLYRYLGLKYKLEGETKSSIAYYVEEREDGWMKTELYQFTSDKRTFDLKIQFRGSRDQYHTISLEVEGIEFRPVEKVEDEASEDDKINIQPISELDIDWEQMLPSDYEEIIKWAKDSLEWTTKKELYSLFCKGFLINDGEEYFSLAKNGKNCYMLSARAALVTSEWRWKSLSKDISKLRFGEAAYDASNWRFSIVCKIKSQMLLPQTTYACYLVYKIREDPFKLEARVKVIDEDFDLDDCHAAEFWFIYLFSPQTQVIRPKVGQNTHNPSDTPKRKGLPQLRNDGWMEVQVWEFRTTTTSETILMHFKLVNSAYNKFKGLIVQGIELKPL